MSVVQLLAMAFGTVTLANVCALGIYYSTSTETEEDAVAVVEVEPQLEEEGAEQEGTAETGAESVTAKTAGFVKTPYSEHYAVSTCEDRADTRYGSKLVHRHIIDLSTRYDNYAEFFVVVLYAHLGTRSDYSEVKVYCHVDPKSYAISYFKDYPA